jgi:hypothetical protein
MKKHWALGSSVLAIVTLALGSGAAFAQSLEPTATAAGPQPLGETSALRVSLTVAPMPAGTLKASAGAFKAEGDTAFAVGLIPSIDLALGQFAFVGFAPQYIFNVKGKDATGDAGSELDLRLRVGGNAKVADTIMLFGYAAPGYGIVMPSGDGENAKGFVLGFAGGAMLALTPGMFLSAEVGYQVGYQKVEVANVSGDLKTNYMHIGVGLGFRI